MYLAEHTIQGRKRYSIRTSFYNKASGCWECRDLFDLGTRPWEYVRYPGGNAFYIAESVGERLAALDVAYDICELEELFWPFIRQEIRRKVEPFYCRGRKKTGYKQDDGARQQIRFFDRRRMYFLRCGAVDQTIVDRMPLRYFRPLLNKSRDEIEQCLLKMEKNLHPREYKHYVYIVFDLQRYFRSSPARGIPQALNQDELDRYFIKDLCRLHVDELFWAGFPRRDGLHEYLVRYAVMFFDYEFDGGSAWDEYLQNFINSRRFYRPPPLQTKVTATEIVEIFGVNEQELDAMGRAELIRLFRQKAHELHPDKGGEHDAFVRLTEAYKQLLRQKS
ncbi:MAG: hypothetical protein ACWGN1_07130 [Desulfobulbales bacterium]